MGVAPKKGLKIKCFLDLKPYIWGGGVNSFSSKNIPGMNPFNRLLGRNSLLTMLVDMTLRLIVFTGVVSCQCINFPLHLWSLHHKPLSLVIVPHTPLLTNIEHYGGSYLHAPNTGVCCYLNLNSKMRDDKMSTLSRYKPPPPLLHNATLTKHTLCTCSIYSMINLSKIYFNFLQFKMATT